MDKKLTRAARAALADIVERTGADEAEVLAAFASLARGDAGRYRRTVAARLHPETAGRTHRVASVELDAGLAVRAGAAARYIGETARGFVESWVDAGVEAIEEEARVDGRDALPMTRAETRRLAELARAE